MGSWPRHLRLREIRAVYDLLGEVRELGGDLEGWRRHMLAGLCRLTGSCVGLTTEVADAVPRGGMRLISPVIVDHRDLKVRELWRRYFSGGAFRANPAVQSFVHLQQRHWFVTISRTMVMEDGPWYGSAHVQEVRKETGVDDLLISAMRLPNCGAIIGFALGRQWGDRNFEGREWRMARLLHLQLLRLMKRSVAEQGLDLSPRLRQTLEYLKQGDGEKEIAGKLDISVHTVHDYVKALYRHFGVNSRGELLARFIRRGNMGTDTSFGTMGTVL